jgi:hypothetical protein
MNPVKLCDHLASRPEQQALKQLLRSDVDIKLERQRKDYALKV